MNPGNIVNPGKRCLSISSIQVLRILNHEISIQVSFLVDLTFKQLTTKTRINHNKLVSMHYI